MHPSIHLSLSRKSLYITLILTTVLFAMFGTQGLLSASAQKGSTDDSANMIVSLSTRNNKTLFGATEDVVLQVSITNPNDHSIKILKWLTPLEGVQEPLFTVVRDGTPVEYLGPVYKRAVPTEQDYLTLTAGKSLTSEVNLSALYDFSISGNYEISYEVLSEKLYLADRQEEKKLSKTGSLISNTMELVIEEHATPAPPEIAVQAVTGSTSFNSCSASRQTDLLNARNGASTYASEAVSYFTANNHGSRYTTWFGAYDATRYNTVSSHFSAIRNAMDTAPMNFDCTCTDPSVYAYVYPTLPYSIYLCGAFWTAPVTGTDSKAGTLIHETSHFNVVAGTHDYAYGQSASQALAASNPPYAIMNADSHEYFAENNPPIVEPTAGITNGDFEAGVTGWTEYSSNGYYLVNQWYDGSGYPPLAHSGTWYTWLGGNYSETSILSQSVTISAYTPYLKLWYIVNSTETCGQDYGYVKINSTSIYTWNLCSANSSADWQALKLNLSAFSGQTVSLQISAVITPSTMSDLFIDDVSLSGTFVDVPANHWAWQYIESLYNANITGGCIASPLTYCPDSSVTRAQMAVFLEKGIRGSTFTAPNVTPTFTDTAGHWAEDWIEALRSDGITGGCGTNIYCPENPVTRDQMAVFLLKAEHGSSYTPPSVGASTGFSDVPVSHWAAAWIKQLAAEGITGGCGTGTYCPGSPVTRAQMAVFLVKTFGLP